MSGARVDEAPRIAVVNDNSSILEAVAALLRSMGFAADAFSSGQEFLDSPRLAHTACLVADVNMPGLSGPDLYRELLALGRRVPTILITAYPNERIRQFASSMGIFFLAKPFGEDDLLRCIRACLGAAG